MADETLKTVRTLHNLLLAAVIGTSALAISPTRPEAFDAALRELNALRTADWDSAYPLDVARLNLAQRRDNEQRVLSRLATLGIRMPPSRELAGRIRGLAVLPEGASQPLRLTTPDIERMPLEQVVHVLTTSSDTLTFDVLVPSADEIDELLRSFETIFKKKPSSDYLFDELELDREFLWPDGTRTASLFMSYRKPDGSEQGSTSIQDGPVTLLKASAPSYAGWLMSQPATSELATVDVTGTRIWLPATRAYWDDLRQERVSDAYTQMLVRKTQSAGSMEIDLAGLKVRGHVAVLAGLIATLAIQLYLHCYLIAIRKMSAIPKDGDATFPWVALYPDRLSRAVTFVTLGALPTTALAFVAVQYSGTSRTVTALASITALLTAVVSVVQLQHISQIRTTNTQEPRHEHQSHAPTTNTTTPDHSMQPTSRERPAHQDVNEQ